MNHWQLFSLISWSNDNHGQPDILCFENDEL